MLFVDIPSLLLRLVVNMPVVSIQIFELSLHLRITSAYEYCWCVYGIWLFLHFLCIYTEKLKQIWPCGILWCLESEKDGNVNKQDTTDISWCDETNKNFLIPNFCTFEIASLPNVPGHYVRKYGILGTKYKYFCFWPHNRIKSEKSYSTQSLHLASTSSKRLSDWINFATSHSAGVCNAWGMKVIGELSTLSRIYTNARLLINLIWDCLTS